MHKKDLNYMENYGNGKQVYIRKLSEEDYSVYRKVNYSRSLLRKVFDDNMMQVFGRWQMPEIFLCVPLLKRLAKEYADSAS